MILFAKRKLVIREIFPDGGGPSSQETFGVRREERRQAR